MDRYRINAPQMTPSGRRVRPRKVFVAQKAIQPPFKTDDGLLEVQVGEFLGVSRDHISRDRAQQDCHQGQCFH
jgi:hypothetical protein